MGDISSIACFLVIMCFLFVILEFFFFFFEGRLSPAILFSFVHNVAFFVLLNILREGGARTSTSTVDEINHYRIPPKATQASPQV